MEKTTLDEKIIKLFEKHNINYLLYSNLADDLKIMLIEQSTPNESIKYIKDRLLSAHDMKNAKRCPVCDQNVKMYQHKLDSGTTHLLVKLYKLTLKNPQKLYFHVTDDIDVPNTIGGRWAKLRWWGLIEEKKKDSLSTEKRTSGLWRITQKGKEFVQGDISVQQCVLLYNAECHGTSGPLIDIKHALTDRFNYSELMAS